MPRAITGVSGVRVDMLVYISASQRRKIKLLSPTKLAGQNQQLFLLHIAVRDLRLIVTLAISYCFLPMPAVGQGMADIAQVPLLVLLFLEDLDPHVRDSHGEPVVEAHTSQRQRQAKGGHARNILGDSDALRIKFMKELIGQHEVDHSFFIDIGSKVFVVTTRKPAAKRN